MFDLGELLAVFVALAAVIAIVAVIGHGIWVLAATLLGVSRRVAPERRRSCPVCARPLFETQIECRDCGWSQSGTTGDQVNAGLGVLLRQLLRLRQTGAITFDAYQRLQAAVEAEQSRLNADKTQSAPLLNRSASAAAMRTLGAADASADDVVPMALAVVESAEPLDLSPSTDQHRETTVTAQTPTIDVGQRARQYAASRQAAAATPEPPPAPPRRPLAQLLAAFMEEKNMRWGELAGGLLIVCCSVALVISFWSQIEQLPFLKFFVFNGVTAALFAVGFYTFRRWKLQTTSHGLLMIATLLVPLNFLAIAAIAKGTAALDAWTLAGEVASTVLFAGMVFSAGRILTPDWPASLAIAVVVPSVTQLLVRRFVSADTPPALLILLLTPAVAVYATVAGQMTRSLFRRSHVDERVVNAVFRLLGMASFALLLALGLLLFRTEAPYAALHDLAPLVTLMGMPALSLGLVLWRRLATPELSGLRTAGTSIGVVGLVIAFAGLILAWPDPALMLPIAVMCGVLMIVLAWGLKLPEAHLLAAGSLAWAALIGFYAVTGRVGWRHEDSDALTGAILSATSGSALLPVAVLFGGVAAWLRPRRAADGRFYAAAALIAAAISLALVTWFGFGVVGDPVGATWAYAFYAAAALAAGWMLASSAATWIGSALLLAALCQGIVFRFDAVLNLQNPWLAALLTHATAVSLAALTCRWSLSEAKRGVVWALSHSGLATSAAAAGLLAIAATGQPSAWVAGHLFWLSAAWLASYFAARVPGLFSAVQVAVTLGVWFAVTATVEHQPWFTASAHPRLDPWHLQSQGIALGMLSILWIALRIGLARWRSNGFFSPRFTVDRIVANLVVAGLVVLAIYAALPGALQEISPRDPTALAASVRTVPDAARFEWLAIPHEHALGVGSWLLVAVVLFMLALSLWERFRAETVLLMFVASAACVPLLASRWEPQVAVASALRWHLALFMAIASVPIWFRAPIARGAARLGWPAFESGSGTLAGSARTLVLVLGIAPLMAMGLYIAVAAVTRATFDVSVRWLLPISGVAFVLASMTGMGLRFATFGREQTKDVQSRTRPWQTTSSDVLLIVGAAPLVILLLFMVAVAIKQHPIVGPDPASLFARMGLSASYAIPVLVMAALLVGFAIREQAAHYAFAAGLLLNLSVTAGYLLALSGWGLSLDAVQWIRVIQINAITSAVYALAWMAAERSARRQSAVDSPSAFGGLLTTQVLLGVAFNALVIVPAVAWLAIRPSPDPLLVEAGGALAWTAAALAAAALAWWLRAAGANILSSASAAALVGVGWLVALTACRWDTGNWLGFHTLIVAQIVVAVAVLAGGTISRQIDRALPWVTGLSVLTVLLALRAVAGDRAWPWWSLAAIAAISAIAVAQACLALRPGFLIFASTLVNLAASIWWINQAAAGASGFLAAAIELVDINIVALALPVPCWLLIDLLFLRPRQSQNLRSSRGWHATATGTAIVLAATTVGFSLWAAAAGEFIITRPLAKWGAISCATLAAVSCLWDGRSRVRIAGLYFMGLVICGGLLDALRLPAELLGWSGMLILAAYSLFTSYLWSRRAGLLELAEVVRIPLDDRPTLPYPSPPKGYPGRGVTAGDDARWLVRANCTLAGVVVLLAYWVELTFADLALRISAAQAAIVQAFAIGLLARGERRSSLQYASLTVGVVGAVAFGWSWLSPGLPGLLHNRAVITTAALAAMALFYGLGLVKLLRRENEWTLAAERLMPVLVVGVALSLAFILGDEVISFAQTGEVAISWPSIVTVAVTLIGVSLAALAAAVLPGRDPLNLSENGRMGYVYAAEAVLGLLFLHIRLTMPWLFRGFFQQYWPLIVMAIAFVGVGLSELMRRQHRRVLSEPLERSAALLPLLPVLGFWVLPESMGFAVDYSIVLLPVALLYAVLSVTRRSFRLAVLAALAVNGALWYYLQRAGGLALYEHPQLWLIPPALCVLVAAWLNREQLDEQQMTTIRYLASITIYVSSTADIFLNGVAQQPWLPVVLAGLSLVGIFAGILLRIRAFLYLGTSFLALALFTIIWYAAVDLQQTWLWSVSGIVAGALIIAVFAVFEKKRDDVLRMIEGLKEWRY